MKRQLEEELEQLKSTFMDMSNDLYNHPELGDEEFESMRKLTDLLKEHDFQVETNIVNRPTAFKATVQSEKPGPTIAYLAEYDALPGIGHGCGHNLIGTMSVGAGIILSKLIHAIGGRIIVFGTPAEETNGAKVPMSKEGIFTDVDVAMMLHPGGESAESGSSLAIDALQFTYQGKSSHAAASPEKGINALDSVIHLFNGINALREHLSSDVRLHGIISEGGQAANVVPDLATAQFYIRAKTRETVDETVEKVKRVAKGAAEMTGATLDITNYQISYDHLVTNKPLSDAFTQNLKASTGKPVRPATHSNGSLDMGDVSRVVPAIHPYIGLGDASLVAHTREFADRTVTEPGQKALLDGILALASTGYDVLTDDVLLAKIKKEFSSMEK